MNEQEYRKQLLVQRIQSQRELVVREITHFKDSSPVAPVLSFLRALSGIWNAVTPGVAALAGGLSHRAKLFGFDLALLFPLLIPLVGSLLGRGKRRP